MLYHVARITWYWPTERCRVCHKGFRFRQIYARLENGKMAHFRCAVKKKGWKRKSRKIEPPPKLEFAPVNRPIKIVKHYER